MSLPIIFDTDPGVDDAQAIALLFADPAFEVIGLTTTFGNVPVTTATRNALLLTELAGRDTPVAAGVVGALRTSAARGPASRAPSTTNADPGLTRSSC